MSRYDPNAHALELDDPGPDPSDFLCECGAERTGGTPSRPVYADCTCGSEPLRGPLSLRDSYALDAAADAGADDAHMGAHEPDPGHWGERPDTLAAYLDGFRSARPAGPAYAPHSACRFEPAYAA